jgi:hypothetical protein
MLGLLQGVLLHRDGLGSLFEFGAGHEARHPGGRVLIHDVSP